MTSSRLAEAFLERARARLAALDALRDEADYSDVAREARDIADLCFRGMLRVRGIEVTRWRDAGDVLEENIDRFPTDISAHRDRLMKIYRSLAAARDSPPPTPQAPAVNNPAILATDQAIADVEWILKIARLTVDILGHHGAPVGQAH